MFDRSWTLYLPGGAGPQAISLTDLSLPGGSPSFELEAWTGGIQGTNLFVFDGDFTLGQAQGRLLDSAHRLDALLVIPPGGRGRVRMPSDMSGRLTIFQDAADASPQAVTLRLRQTD